MRGFSTGFPRGGAGVGLFMLRLAVALQLLSERASADAGALPWWQGVLATMLPVLLTLLLGLGLLTPVAAALGALYQLFCLGQANWGQAPAVLVAALTACALVLLGPGAYAADARLFGRRRLVLPPEPPEHGRF